MLEQLIENPKVKIHKITVSTHRKGWVIYITAHEELLENLEEIKSKAIMEIPDLKELDICVLNNGTSLNIEDILKYNFTFIKRQLSTQFPGLESSLCQWDVKINEKNINILVTNCLQHYYINLKKINKWLEKFIWDTWKVECTLNFQLQESGSKPTDLGEKEEKYILDFVKSLPEKSSIAKPEASSNTIIKGKAIKKEAVAIETITEEDRNISLWGQVLNYDEKVTRAGRTIINFDITDYTDSISCKIFIEQDEKMTPLNKGQYVRVYGTIQYDKFTQELTMFPRDINSIQIPSKQDESENKRIELHAHTKMSSMDATCTAKELIKRAAQWGHEAIAITDHGIVQSFPDAYEAGKENGIKVIYGVEGYLVDDVDNKIVINSGEGLLEDTTYVVFDFETTGLDHKKDEIIEIGAVKIRGRETIDQFSSLVKPKAAIPPKITEITGITNNDVSQSPPISEVFKEFLAFCGDSVLVAHNANFDYNFLISWSTKLQYHYKATVIDTLALSRAVILDIKNHKLKTLTDYYGIKLENHHRAVDDCKATSELFLKLLMECQKLGCTSIESLTKIPVEGNIKNQKSYHCIIIAKNYTGLKNLYKLISLSHVKYFYRQPRIPKSIIENFREGLIIGSACESGEIFQLFLENKPHGEIEKKAEFYDYLEVQPWENNEFLVKKGLVETQEDLKEINKKIISLAEKVNKPVIATGDVHFLEERDAIYREILMTSKGFTDAHNQPPLYFKTTGEMLKDFNYLPEKQRLDVVINNPKKISDQVEAIKPIPDDLYTPKIDNADEMIRQMCEERGEKLYGTPIPAVVQARLDKELTSIIKHGFGVIYYISHKLVTKSLSDGYLVGSRGSVGSSLVATFTDITEVNPLPPHYICPSCKYSEFIEDGSVGSGVDLPDKNCPKCAEKLKKDGHDIPFETFLGFNGDKVPDIDLNFSGDYQPKAHKYTEELFGKDYVFRAGTIATVADKTAYGFVQKYYAEKNIRKRTAEINRMVQGCTGIKRTTGQHPGGLMVVPNYKDVYDFCPIQHPADDRESGTVTTHFDYNAISSRLLKLDILGHDDPTVIKMLEDLTGENALNIPLDHKETMSIFSSTNAIGLTESQLGSKVATLGIPEFGTKFVRQMLEDTKPTTFSELVRISGLSHGTDVWLNNAQELVKNSIATLSEVISTRDDIMVYLIYKGLDPSQAFTIMESVRKGKGLTNDQITVMKQNDVPSWYIDSCLKIKYMFPKAHAVAYVTMAFRIAYFKVKHPLAFYAAYFSVRADDFNMEMVAQGEKGVREQIKFFGEKGNNLTAKEKSTLTILEVILEMLLRGFTFHKIDLYRSHHANFLLEDNGLIPPFSAISGLGKNAAKSVVEARKQGEFLSIEELRQRTGLSKTVLETMTRLGYLAGLPETNQLSLF